MAGPSTTEASTTTTNTTDASKFQLPEWEHKKPQSNNPPPQPSLKEQYRSLRFHVSVFYNRLFPPQKRYCNQPRHIFLSILLVSFLALLAVILGLSLGLTRGGNETKNLPLGTQQYEGDLTYYGVGLGACGWAATDSQMVVSISHFVFDRVSVAGNPNANPLCGKRLRAVRGERSVDLKVVDRCVGCQPTDIDVSPAAFAKLADPALGRVEVNWAWLDSVPHGR